MEQRKRDQFDEELELNYNDRLDGYGFGPPESMDDKLPYEKERRQLPDVGHDDYGLRNQYGPVDQYSFRDMYQRKWSRPAEVSASDEEDWRDWDRERFGSDDYSRFAGPGYRESSGPGVSGKARRMGPWFNREKYEQQKSFVGKGPRGYRRSDERIYEEVCEVLHRSPDLNAEDIEVEVREGVVYLEGFVPGRQGKRLAEYLVEDLPGVVDVQNGLRLGPRETGY